MMPQPQLPAPGTLHERLTDFLRMLSNGKLGTAAWRRAEARCLLQAIEEGPATAQDGGSPHYVQPRPGWEPGIAFEGQAPTRGNIEPEEGLLKTSHGGG